MPADAQTTPGAPDSNSNQTRPQEGMIQDLQRMYEQRLELQQGQKAPPVKLAFSLGSAHLAPITPKPKWR